jgi:hypothetical protein
MKWKCKCCDYEMDGSEMLFEFMLPYFGFEGDKH